MQFMGARGCDCHLFRQIRAANSQCEICSSLQANSGAKNLPKEKVQKVAAWLYETVKI